MYQTQKYAGEIIAAVLDGQTLTDAFNRVWKLEPNLRPQQRGAIQDLGYGTLRHLGLLQRVLESLLNKPMREPELRALLLVSLYQLHFTRAAPYTIVDHAVKVAAHTGAGKGKGLVNAILRNFMRQRNELVGAAERTPLGRWSHPVWWISALQKAYPQQWEAILAAGNQHPPMTLRVNRRRGTLGDYQARLQDAGIAARALDDDSALLLKQPVGVDMLPGFFDGDASVQDWGAQRAAQLLDVRDGMRVLDACAAPGGKTGHILELADVDLTAVDFDAQRLSRVADNLKRLNLTATLKTGDAGSPTGWWDGKLFDRILADVPCSATGVARRHPDIKWLRRPEDFASFARQQAEMLDALWPLVAPGGKLLYATCSIFPAENSEQAAAFAARHADAERLPLNLPGDGQLLPSPEHDGFFYALFSKRPV
ncbi:16S rRNA (cytosine967-C5)-methyltransferase [Andreprevotia lacus DSM 23236]|jgi:16S rRNA (cytosine967-C5)-methyltransferase|uniref:16S rRNA (cytosine(967)-C(5))-methyltransferase n=1 Tax=Andreprevotia lacus DSM 23236 TaxID=1121001 RepID=A0A1W1XXW9_9NEIS|nr:16S rRNA (cytosine(967)-C(5))-methyltransferase RsmB [Andreprevotia lacus]SMC28725.1 16S rRNA (cytosine967-C5)-methyltransferase [Andreprevotia lacus DSM 23236]